MAATDHSRKRAAIEMVEPICIECGKLASLVTVEDIYPGRGRVDGDRPMWRCECGAYVGCHPHTDIPLGYPAGPRTRGMRQNAHAVFDALWQAKMQTAGLKKGVAREAGYVWLAEQLGVPRSACHMAHFDLETATKVVDLCAPILKRLNQRKHG